MPPSSCEQPAEPAPFWPCRGGVKVRLRVSPRSASDRVLGLWHDPGSGTAVRVAVSKPAEGGKANAAVIRLLAREWGIAKSALSVAAGHTDRRKIVAVLGDPQRLLTQLTAWSARCAHEQRR